MEFLLPDATYWFEKLGIYITLGIAVAYVLGKWMASLVQKRIDMILKEHDSVVEQVRLITEAFKDPNDIKDKKIIPMHKLRNLMNDLNQKCGTENCPVISMVSTNIQQEEKWRAEMLETNKQTFEMFRQFVSGFGETAIEALLTLSERLRNGQQNQNR